MDDCPSTGIGVINRDLIVTQAMLEDFVFDPGKRQCSGCIEPECLQIARDQFHRSDTAVPDVRNECLAVGKGRLRSPQPEPRRIGEIVDVRSAGSRSVKHTGAREQVLQAHPGDPLLRSLDLAARPLAACGVGHGVGFVEDDHAAKVFAGPGQELVEPGGIAPPRTQGWIGHEQDAFAHRDGTSKLPLPERLDVDRQTAQRCPVAPCVLEQGFILRNPDMAVLAPHPAVEDHAGDLATLARTGPVAEKIALAVCRAVFVRRQRATPVLGHEAPWHIAGMRAGRIDQRLHLGCRQDTLGNEACRQLRDLSWDRRGDRAHRNRFHQRRWMGECAFDCDATGPIGQVVAQLLGNRRRCFKGSVITRLVSRR